MKRLISATACILLLISLMPAISWAGQISPAKQAGQPGIGQINSLVANSPAQTPPAPVQPALVQTLPPPQPMVKGGQPAKADNSVVLNFQDADLLDVIHTIFCDILKVNYTVDPQVKGKVTIRIVNPISHDNILPTIKMILKQNGAGFTVENGIYKILPLNEIPDTAQQVYVYPLQNSKADHVAQILQSIFTGASMPAAAGHPPVGIPQPMGGAGGKRSLVSPSTRVIADQITNSLVILATPEDYKFIKKTIKQLDTIPRQVMIDVLIAEVNLSGEFQFGLEWVLSNGLRIATSSLTGIAGQGVLGIVNGTSSVTPPAILQPPPPSGGFTYTAVDSSGNVKALLQMLASKGKVNVLASPHIIAADNRESRIQIGQEIPIATSQATNVGTAVTPGTTSILSTIQYKDTGVILKVKPQINESGLVSLEINAEDSEAEQTLILGTEQFVIDKKQVATDLVAQDGQTIVLGGLISQETQKSRSGIPLLSDIPVLGYLFSTTDNKTSKDEIIVLMTPHVIRNQKEAGSVTDQYIGRIKGLDKNFDTDIPGLSGGKKQK